MHQVLCSEKIGEHEIKLTQTGDRFRVVVPFSRGKLAFPALTATWTFRTREAAQRAFEAVTAMERCGYAIMQGEPTEHLFQAQEAANEAANAAMKANNDYPPESQ